MTLNGYCHMVAPKILLFLGEVPRESWPAGADALRDEWVRVLRAREVFRCLPAGSREFMDAAYTARKDAHRVTREEWIAEHGPLEYGPKPGWLRFGYPLAYNSDVLEALRALMAVGEVRRPEYEPAIAAVRDAGDEAVFLSCHELERVDPMRCATVFAEAIDLRVRCFRAAARNDGAEPLSTPSSAKTCLTSKRSGMSNPSRFS